MAYDRVLVNDILAEAKQVVQDELKRVFAERRRTGYGPLYDMLADYPFREGKGLRPAICISACRAVGGYTDQAVLSATALELFHNAFLLHDDVEDESEFRRGTITMLKAKGAPIAINVGDATNVLAMAPLLGNTERLGVRKALLVFREVERMARESAEGQAIELSWIAEGRFDLADRDYVRMAYKKTCQYTVIAPLRIGAICGMTPGKQAFLDSQLRQLTELGFLAGIAFQIHDDLLNLDGDEIEYGKENGGDLWEGKRTVMLLQFLRTADKPTRRRALEILERSRKRKKQADIHWLLNNMRSSGALDYGRKLASSFCQRALTFDSTIQFWQDNEDRRFLREMLTYIIDRTK